MEKTRHSDRRSGCSLSEKRRLSSEETGAGSDWKKEEEEETAAVGDVER